MLDLNFPSSINQTSPYAKEIIEKLKPYADIRRVLPNRRLSPTINTANYCYLVMEGRVMAYRTSDDRMISTINAPFVCGFMGIITQSIDIYLKTTTPALIGKILLNDVDGTEKLLNELNLWEPLSKHMMFAFKKYYICNQQITAPSAYEIVCAQLQILMNEQRSLRTSITAEMYIRNKTTLSRSCVMQVLSDLKKGGHVEIDRGILNRINSLPDKN